MSAGVAPAGVASGGVAPAGAALVGAARGLRAGADALGSGIAAVDRPPPGWAGAAASAAEASRARLAQRGLTWSGAVRQLADGIDAALSAAAASGGAAAPDGGTAPGAAASGDSAAADVEARVAAALAAALAVPLETPPPAAPAPGLDPEAVAGWWAGLGGPEREALLRERPALVGGLDGVPAADRDRANRRVLDGATRDARDRLAALVVAAVTSPGTNLGTLTGAITQAARRLESLARIRRAAEAPGRALLLFEDAPDGRPHAAVAQGDVDTAAHVGVYTPGFTSSTDDLDDQLGELSAVGARAGPGTAMVVWDGYDAPQWSGVADPARSVLSQAPADAAAPRLARFLGGLDAARPGTEHDPHLTAIGHSYGSLTTAQAVERAPGVDDVVHLGSPGLGTGATARPGHTWVAEAAGDPVADAGWFGADPNRMPGTTGLSTREVSDRDGVVTSASTGHGSYLAAGTTSAANVAAVVSGRPDAVVLDRGVGVGDRVRALFGG